MNQIVQLTSRNLKIFLRDKTAVFFSLMSMLIVIMLMVVFLGDMNIRNITGMLENFGERNADTDKNNAELLVLMWTIAGIISINAVTITLSAISTMIDDCARNRIQSLYTSPVSRLKIALGYLCSAWIASVIICILTMAVAEAYAVFRGVEVLSFKTHMKILGMIIVNSFTYASVMYFAALMVRTEKAWSSLGTIIGTLVGFLGTIYIPMAGLPDGVQSVLKCLPVLHGASMFRAVITEDILAETFKGVPDSAVDEFCEQMGITVTMGDTAVKMGWQLAFLLVCGIIFLAVSAIIMKYRSQSDR